MLTAGTKMGPYEVVSSLGAGGMGEVYRARDSRLHRDVALKVLPEALAANAERLARLEREAQVLASLRHPNIATIFGVEDSGNTRALVLELVEGDTLAERIARGPMPLDEALPIARQIADALEAAHEQGVIHRDLKPANVKVTADGTVKVLDCGLAKIFDTTTGSGSPPAMTNSPTLSLGATAAGMILGTAAYMSPEQARGKPVDRRGDLWAFGCVLYEMITGRRAFAGEEVSDTLAEVIKSDPDWSALPADAPPAIRRLLRRCLMKDRRARVADASIARIEIDEAMTAPVSERAAPQPVRAASPWRVVVPLAAIALAALAVAGVAGWKLLRRSAPESAITRFPIELPPGAVLAANSAQRFAISSDGRTIAYNATGGAQRLYVRSLDQLEAAAIRGIEGNIGSLLLSPDGQWIAYNDTASGAFKKVRVAGGPPATIFEARSASGGFRGAAWGSNGMIVYATTADPALMQVRDTGGALERLTKPPEGEVHAQPAFMPDGRALLFVVTRSNTPPRIFVMRFDGQQPRELLAGSSPHFAASGHLVFWRENAVWAVAFDPGRLEIKGDAVPVVEGVDYQNATALFAISDTGSLLYSPAAAGQAERSLVWVDRTGREEAVGAPARVYGALRLSPDGVQIAAEVRDQEDDIWIWNLRRAALTRFTFGRSVDRAPVWSADGRRIAFMSTRDGSANMYWQPADGTGAVERLVNTTNGQFPMAFTPDGRALVLREDSSRTPADLMILPLDGSTRAQPLVASAFFETNGAVSSDGKWLTYTANESGPTEVFVRPFPDAQKGRWQISSGGGTQPIWSRDGRELFYLDQNALLAAVEVRTTPTFSASTPKTLLNTRYFSGIGTAGRSYDVAADGKRFLMLKEATTGHSGPQLVLVQNWFDELTRKVPTR